MSGPKSNILCQVKQTLDDNLFVVFVRSETDLSSGRSRRSFLEALSSVPRRFLIFADLVHPRRVVDCM